MVLCDILLDDLTYQEYNWLPQIRQQGYQKRATIILSQKPMPTWKQILPPGANADAIMDRLVHYSYYLELKEEKSLRTFIED